MQGVAHTLVTTRMGTVAVVWQESARGPQVLRIFLPQEERAARQAVFATYPGAEHRHCAQIDELGGALERFLRGEEIRLPLELLALDRCSPFQKSVLLADWQIPRGWVSTYGAIARRVGRPGAARAVGRALACNPFPLVIPCHRVIAADRSLGGFQGGLAVKRALLELEGVPFDGDGRVLAARVSV
ncbi:MAG: MGMT family protein [Calditrichaeota bacterium]|nr:MGMT family protein [Calditrichota bacterium]